MLATVGILFALAAVEGLVLRPFNPVRLTPVLLVVLGAAVLVPELLDDPAHLVVPTVTAIVLTVPVLALAGLFRSRWATALAVTSWLVAVPGYGFLLLS